MRNFSIWVLPLALSFLAFTGCKEEKTSLSIAQTVEFNGKKILMNVFYSSVSDNEISLDSLMFEYDNKAQTIHLHNFNGTLNFFSVDLNDFAPINVSDYNFDGFLDFSIYSRNSGMGHNERYETFIYNPKIKDFSHHPMLSDIVNVAIDSKTQTIKSNWIERAGLTQGSDEYKWINGELTRIHSVELHYDEDSQTHIIRKTKTLINGKWEEKEEIISEEGGDDYDDGCPGNAKLLKSITQGELTTKFGYDNKNRIVKIYQYKNAESLKKQNIAYNEYSINVSDMHVEKDQYEITIIYNNQETKIIINQDGYITKEMSSNEHGATTETYQYQNDNMIRSEGLLEEADVGWEREYKYDKKKSPFNCNTPKWLIQRLLSAPYYASKNNPVFDEDAFEPMSNINVYKYEYDSDEFPTKRTQIITPKSEKNQTQTIITTFTYCNKQK